MEEDIRKYQRVAKACRVEYCLFQSIVKKEGLKESFLNDLGAGGASFFTEDNLEAGTQLYLRIYVPGWRQASGELKKVAQSDAQVMLETIAEVVHKEFHEVENKYIIGTKFLGKVNK